MDRFNKGHCFGHEEHTHKTHTHIHTDASCLSDLAILRGKRLACSFRYETVTRPGKAGPFSALSLSLWEPWPVFMIYDNRAKRGESVPVKQQQKPHRQHTYKPQKYLEKNPLPPLNRMWEFLKYSSAGNSPFSGVFETAPLECGYSNPISLMVFLRPPRVHVLKRAARLYLTKTLPRHFVFL